VGGAILAALSLTVACSRSINVPDDGATQGNPAPFQSGRSSEGAAADGSISAAGENGAIPDAGLPFHDSRNVPAGTLLTVRLKEPIDVETPGAKSLFDAVLDHAVVIDGDTLVPRGAIVTGRVESARVSKMKPERGYVRLALESVRIGESDLPVQTSSLFARQTPSRDVSSSTIHLEKGRPLTFRLTESFTVTAQRTQATR